jgi:hypothetical protein
MALTVVKQWAIRAGSIIENCGERQLQSLSIKGEMMRKKVFSAAITGALLVVVAAATAYAQMPGMGVRATIPFDFSVRGKMLPAGDYEIKRLTDEPGELVVASVDRKGGRAIFYTVPAEPRGSSSKPQIVFHRYGDSYFMSEIFAGGLQSACEVPLSRQERNLKREMASNNNNTEPETVAVAAY